MNVAAIVLALVVPACADLAVPHRFGAFLLAGWIGAGAEFSVLNFRFLAVIAGYLGRASADLPPEVFFRPQPPPLDRGVRNETIS